jgi:acetate kinase
MNVLVLNAGSASLKFEVIAVSPESATPDQNRKLVSGAIEGIDEEATLSLLQGKQVVHQEKITASDYGEATRRVIAWLDAGGWEGVPTTRGLHAVGHRVVSLVGYLMRKERVDVSRVEEWLNKESGLLGVSGRSHDTRALMKLIDEDEQVRLALEVFCYRLRKYIGAYLAALGGAEAVIFGGGIGENTPFVRARACEGFTWCGLTLDSTRNEQTIDREGRLTTDDSRLHAYVIPTEEGLLIAQQVFQCLEAK